MRIAHLCLSNWFVDGVGYQENELVRQHVSDGHEVLVVASTETHSRPGVLSYTKPGEYVSAEGARVIRVPYGRWLPEKLMRKLRINSGVLKILRSFKPDSILFHGTCGWEIRTAARYVRETPGVKFYVDSHEDWNNSARNFISRELLHRAFYGPVLRSALGQIDKILCVNMESMDFVHELYGVPREMLEFYPLGGHPIEDGDYLRRRATARSALGVAETDIVILQSGKQTRRKKLADSLRALAAIKDARLRLFICGSIGEDVRTEIQPLIEADSRVAFLGWKSREELTDLLCAADVYLQPGTQSATMQHGLCCRCAVILDDVTGHRPYNRENGWFVTGPQGLVQALHELCHADLSTLQQNSDKVAREMLDYRVLSHRVFS